jgi:hypothetical protein
MLSVLIAPMGGCRLLAVCVVVCICCVGIGRASACGTGSGVGRFTSVEYFL